MQKSDKNFISTNCKKISNKIKKKITKNDFEFYNYLLSILETKKRINFSNNEGIFYTIFLELFYQMDLPNIIYLDNFEKIKCIFKQKINKEKIFKLFIIYPIIIWNIINKLKNNTNAKSVHISINSLYDELKFLISIFCKLYKENIFNYDELEVLTKLFLILSIFPYEFNNKKLENIINHNSIKSFLFINLSVEMYKKLFYSNKKINENEEKTIINYLTFFYEKIINTRISTQLMFSDYDIKTTRFYNFIEILPMSTKIYDIVKNIYISIYKNRLNYNFITLFLKIIKKILINIEKKDISEIQNDISVILFPLELLFKIDNIESFNFSEKGFYLEEETAGFSIPNKTLSDKDKFSICFSFNFNPFNELINEYSLLKMIHRDKPKEEYFKIKISKKKDNSNIYLMTYLVKKKEIKEYIEINSRETYIIYISFSAKEIITIIQKGKIDHKSIYNMKGDIFNKVPISKLEFLIGCDKQIKEKDKDQANNYILKNTYQGYIGSFLLFKKELIYNEKDKNKKKDKKINQNNTTNELQIVFKNIVNNYLQLCYYNQKEYANIQKNIELKVTPNLFTFYNKIEKIDFTEFHEDYTEIKGKKKKFCYLLELKKYYLKDKSPNKSIITYKTNNYLYEGNEIIMEDYFSSYFTTIDYNNSIYKFIEYDGIKILILVVEYFYQIIAHISSLESQNNINTIIVKM